jgi:hypothetical protein
MVAVTTLVTSTIWSSSSVGLLSTYGVLVCSRHHGCLYSDFVVLFVLLGVGGKTDINVMRVKSERLGGRRSHGSPEANLGRETQSRLARGQPRAGDVVTTRPMLTSGGRHSHGSSEANPGRETQLRLAQGQPRAGEPVTPRPRPTSGGRHIHAAFTPHPRPTSDGRSCHDSSEANPEAVHFRLAREHLRRCSGRLRAPRGGGE